MTSEVEPVPPTYVPMGVPATNTVPAETVTVPVARICNKSSPSTRPAVNAMVIFNGEPLEKSAPAKTAVGLTMTAPLPAT